LGATVLAWARFPLYVRALTHVSDLEFVPDPGHDRRYAIDATRTRTELGWAATRSAWPQALAETIDWYRTHEPWWRPLKADAFNATMLSR
jgi:dTDP-D-glucose 4,6-dehydratase